MIYLSEPGFGCFEWADISHAVFLLNGNWSRSMKLDEGTEDLTVLKKL